jgi:hypothetical protein
MNFEPATFAIEVKQSQHHGQQTGDSVTTFADGNIEEAPF